MRLLPPPGATVKKATSCTTPVRPGCRVVVAEAEVVAESFTLQVGFRIRIRKETNALSLTQEEMKVMRSAAVPTEEVAPSQLKRRTSADVVRPELLGFMGEGEFSTTEVLVGGDADGKGWEPATLRECL